MGWVILLLAGLCEIVWAVALKYWGFAKLLPSAGILAAMGASAGLLSVALRSLPVGTAYAVWTGIGAARAATVGMAFLGDAMSAAKAVSIGLILSGVVGLNLSGVTP